MSDAMVMRRFEDQQRRAGAARDEAKALRSLHETATCGLGMQYPFHYGTRGVQDHIARRVADTYIVWADEYDAAAEAIEENLVELLKAVEA